ncbi:MAG: PepSY domain-containing protein, partial [Bacteroidota bacterium]
MTLSLWRLSHLWLAIISGIFLLIASLTGAILSFEPIYERAQGYYFSEADQLSIAELAHNIGTRHSEISSIKRDHNGYIVVTAFGDDGEWTNYVNPFSGERLGNVIKTPEIFDFSRTLHRSLFLGETGRFLVGVAAVLLLIISITGFVLVLKKQGGLTSYFKKVIPDDFYRDYHTKVGKLFVFTILLISVTGGYLFMVRFSLIPTGIGEHQIDFDNINDTPQIEREDIPAFNTYQLGDLDELIFPFSDFVDDFFELKLEDRALLINQVTGEVISQIDYPATEQLSTLSFSLHTAEGQPILASLLGITSLSMLFFMYSGFKIYWDRASVKRTFENTESKDDCSLVVAYGSEMGSTYSYALAVHRALIRAGQKSYLLPMNDFQLFPNLEQLIVITSTYGVGEAPANATRFFKKFEEHRPTSDFQYTVLGFGSTKYPDFCQFAIDVDRYLQNEHKAQEVLPLATVDQGSKNEFISWVEAYQKVTKKELHIQVEEEEREMVELELSKRVFSPNTEDATYLLELTSKNGRMKHIESGDLLVYRPEEDGIGRQYSMSVLDRGRRIKLSIKKHEGGIVSGYLSELAINASLQVSFNSNEHFHFPMKASEVLLIANGTGIAPFLGMIEQNKGKVPTTLFWGGQTEASYALYSSQLDALRQYGHLRDIKTAYSRTATQRAYVQDLIKNDASFISTLLSGSGVIMICGSLNMQKGVEAEINTIV